MVYSVYLYLSNLDHLNIKSSEILRMQSYFIFQHLGVRRQMIAKKRMKALVWWGVIVGEIAVLLHR